MARIRGASKGVKLKRIKFKGEKGVGDVISDTAGAIGDILEDSGIMEIVSVVGGVKKTLNSMASARQNQKATPSKAEFVYNESIKKNTSMMDRLGKRMEVLALKTEVFSKNMTKNISERRNNYLYPNGDRNIGENGKQRKLYEHSAIAKLLTGAFKKSSDAFKKSLSVVTAPIRGLTKVTRTGFKVLDSALVGTIGPMLADMVKYLAVLAGLYVLVEGVRQALYSFNKAYSAGYETFYTKFGEYADSLANIKETIAEFSSKVEKDGLVSAIVESTQDIVTSLGEVVGFAIQNGFDRFMVALNNWWYREDESKQITVEDYQYQRAIRDVGAGRGATKGNEKQYAEVVQQRKSLEDHRYNLIDAVSQYERGGGPSLFKPNGEIDPKSYRIFYDGLTNSQSKTLGQRANDNGTVGSNGKVSSFIEGQYLLNSEEFKVMYENYKNSVGGNEELALAVEKLMTYDFKSTIEKQGGLEGWFFSGYDDRVNNQMFMQHRKNSGGIRRVLSGTEGYNEALRQEEIRSHLRDSDITTLEYGSGQAQKVYDDGMNSGNEITIEMARQFRNIVETRYGKGALKDSPKLSAGQDKEELQTASEITDNNNALLNANTNAINNLAESIKESNGQSNIIMNNSKSNTTIQQPITEIKLISKPLEL